MRIITAILIASLVALFSGFTVIYTGD